MYDKLLHEECSKSLFYFLPIAAEEIIFNISNVNKIPPPPVPSPQLTRGPEHTVSSDPNASGLNSSPRLIDPFSVALGMFATLILAALLVLVYYLAKHVKISRFCKRIRYHGGSGGLRSITLPLIDMGSSRRCPRCRHPYIPTAATTTSSACGGVSASAQNGSAAVSIDPHSLQEASFNTQSQSGATPLLPSSQVNSACARPVDLCPSCLDSEIRKCASATTDARVEPHSVQLQPQQQQAAGSQMDAGFDVTRLVEPDRPLMLGSGRYGIVYKVFYNENTGDQQSISETAASASASTSQNGSGSSSFAGRTLREVAVKVFRDESAFNAERSILDHSEMQHENIVRLLGCYQRAPAAAGAGAGSADEEVRSGPTLVFHYYPHGSLYDYLRRDTLTLEELLRVSRGIASGLAFLHEERPPHKASIIHRDLKSKNVLLRADLSSCIADFGLAYRFDHADGRPKKMQQVRTTPHALLNCLFHAPGLRYTRTARTFPYTRTLTFVALRVTARREIGIEDATRRD